MRPVLKAQINKTDRNDARGIAREARGWREKRIIWAARSAASSEASSEAWVATSALISSSCFTPADHRCVPQPLVLQLSAMPHTGGALLLQLRDDGFGFLD
jgi:hypothetical protein